MSRDRAQYDQKCTLNVPYCKWLSGTMRPSVHLAGSMGNVFENGPCFVTIDTQCHLHGVSTSVAQPSNSIRSEVQKFGRAWQGGRRIRWRADSASGTVRRPTPVPMVCGFECDERRVTNFYRCSISTSARTSV